MKARLARCEAQRLREAFGSRICVIDMTKQLEHKVTGPFGPDGISNVAADLLDVAACVYRCERLLPPAGSTNRCTSFQLSLPLREPQAWSDGAVECLSEILEVLGNAKWTFKFARASAPLPKYKVASNGEIKKRVVLFSGGLDSTCGLAAQVKVSDETLLNSYYTIQKTKQSEIASALGYQDHVQWTLSPLAGPGRSFFYRSFYFLSLAAVLSQSWKLHQLIQYETGILAYAIPPSPWYAMTKHAHPRFLSLVSRLYEKLFGDGPWVIANPFINLTKRQEVAEALKFVTGDTIEELLVKTETCWSHRACHVHGVAKHPGVPCGVCIPCIVRRTALPSDRFQIDLRKTTYQNHEKMGQAFRSYLAFLESVLNCGSVEMFYTLLPSHVRQLVPNMSGAAPIYSLFVRFASEFMETFFG